MKNIAIIPARSGSKGLPDKNIKCINNKPLIAYSIEAAMKSKLFIEIMVSTDSIEYADLAMKYGAKVPFLRSNETSNDVAGSWDVVKEVLQCYEKANMRFDTVTLLQPTSPLRTEKHIIKAFQLMIEKNADSITSVCEMEHSPLWSNVLPSSLSMKEFENKYVLNKGRQQLPLYYRINGAIYIRKINYINSQINLEYENPYAFIMEQKESIDIDSELDFQLAEFLLNIERKKYE